ncbi:hypothetical protein ACRDNQ_10305 [Palleronia sp. KMU-117]|uniref:hypothetical protein n=1 Tax=Palleronia sp. KMU-117 TaxID=3434108 RepID=UPI003D757C4A
MALLYLGLLAGGLWLSTLLHEVVADVEAGPVARGAIVLGVFLFIAFSALPFVPGAEIGLGLLMVLGARGALLVYLAMVAALALSFAMGRFVTPGWIARALGALGLERARDFVLRTADLADADRVRFIESTAPRRWVPFLLRNRYVALALLFNMPGNVVLGGGGGIAFAAGASRLFGAGPYVLTVLIAVAPVPLMFWLFGTGGVWFTV